MTGRALTSFPSIRTDLRNAGADVIVNPVKVGGHLLAGSTEGPHGAEYIGDLATSGGRVNRRERQAREYEIGRPLSEASDGLGVRIYRKGRPHGFWEPETVALERGDLIVEIVRSDSLPDTSSRTSGLRSGLL